MGKSVQRNGYSALSASVMVMSIATIVARRVLGPSPWLDYAAIAALFALTITVIDMVLAVLLKPWRYFNRQFWIGLLFGAISGLAGGLLYVSDYGVPTGLTYEQLAGPAESWARLTRVVVIAAIINAFLHLAEQIYLLRHSLGHRRHEGLAILLASVAAIVLAAFVAAGAPDWIGRPANFATAGLVDWIGTGRCGPWPDGPSRVSSDECSLGILRTYQIITIVGVSALMTVLYYGRALSLSRGRLMFALAGLAFLLGATYALLYFSGTYNQLLPLKDPLITAALTAMWVAYVGFLIGILRWARNMALNEALIDAFKNREAFGAMLSSRLGRKLTDFSPGSSFDDTVDAVVDDAKENNWLHALIVNARFSRPDHAGLSAVADRAGVGILPPEPANIDRVAEQLHIDGPTPEIKFQRIVRSGAGFIPPADWDLRKAKIEKCVCRVEQDGVPLGTGFLVKPDLVLTNFHVVEPYIKSKAWAGVQCRFDYKAAISTGVIYQLSAHQPEVASSPPSSWDLNPNAAGPEPDKLDFALIRLAEPAGNLPLGQSPEANAPVRGHIDLSKVKEQKISKDAIVLIMQHPRGGPLQQDIGFITDVIKDGLRLRHSANTLEGSSGAPCFAIHDLTPVAIHHLGAGWESQPGSLYNQAISLKIIIEAIARAGPDAPQLDQ